jgi:phosphoribosyl 1,2-cyclic phosphodiesterase
MRVKFWGTRGSIPTPGRTTEKYGGNTSCVEVTHGGRRVILDGGTGIRELGLRMAGEEPAEVVIMFSHCHWDHIQGLPFFVPFFKKGFRFRIAAPPQLSRRIKAILGKQMASEVFPVDFADLSSDISFQEMPASGVKAGPFRIGHFALNHPGGSAGYRIEAGGKSLVYATDHEFAPQDDPRTFEAFVRHLKGANLYIADGQYVDKEYEERHGWGHSTIEHVVAAAKAACVRRLAVTHHDPMHDDPALTRFEHDAMKQHPGLEVFFAREGIAVEV